MRHWYHIDNIDQHDSPALIVYPERVKENIRQLIKSIDDVGRLRPHVKTCKSIDATRLMMHAGIQKFKCATIAEAEMLALSGVHDILLAYQPVGPKLKRLIMLILKYPLTKFSCLVDNLQAATEMDDEMGSAGKQMIIYIDLNVGMNRTGITPGREALQLYLECSALKNLGLAGLHVYDGHLRNPDINIRTAQCNEAFSHVERLRDKILLTGIPEPVIVAGGSPTFLIHAQRKKIECSPGTFIYWDKGYQLLCPEQPFQPAALVLTRVISLPSTTTLCLDLGHKSIASENDLLKRVYFLDVPDVIPVAQSEEHLVVRVSPDHSYQIGDVFYGLPFHICPTCALYEKAFTVQNHQLNGEWKTVARDRKIGDSGC